MDKGREKRKKGDKEIEDGRKKKVRGADGEEEAAAAGGSATEQEVDEFFSILRSMQVVIKYFERGNGEGWRAALETDAVAVAGAGGDEKKEGKVKKAVEEVPVVVEEVAAVVLDLNATPDVGEQ